MNNEITQLRSEHRELKDNTTIMKSIENTDITGARREQ